MLRLVLSSLFVFAFAASAQETKTAGQTMPVFASAVFGKVTIEKESIEHRGKLQLTLSMLKKVPVATPEEYTVKVFTSEGAVPETRTRIVNRMVTTTEEQTMHVPAYRIELASGKKIRNSDFVAKLNQLKKHLPVIVMRNNIKMDPNQLALLKDSTVLLFLEAPKR